MGWPFFIVSFYMIYTGNNHFSVFSCNSFFFLLIKYYLEIKKNIYISSLLLFFNLIIFTTRQCKYKLLSNVFEMFYFVNM